MIYLDNAATTKIDDKVLKEMMPYLKESYGNASSNHYLGRKARTAIEKSRKTIANYISARPDEIIFTSGGTESNNLALKGVAFVYGKGHIITTKIEHESVLEACKWLEKEGWRITYLNVNKEGFIDTNELESNISNDTKLVSVIHGNNEIGTIQDISKIGEICKKHKILFHIDACQSFGKVRLDIRKINVDLISLNAHKIYGPKGVGVLFVKKGIRIDTLFHGGGHEFDKRSGTENVSCIVGFGKAVEILNKKNITRMEKLNDRLISGLLKIDGTRLNGPRKERLCNNTNIGFKGINADILESSLDAKGICVSSGSACASRRMKSSHVLKALPGNDNFNSSIRFSLSKYTTQREIDETIKIAGNVVKTMRSINIK
jgi:cysteine desulfurase